REIATPSRGGRRPCPLWLPPRGSFGTAAAVTHDRTVARLPSHVQGRLPWLRLFVEWMFLLFLWKLVSAPRGRPGLFPTPPKASPSCWLSAVSRASTWW